MLNDEICKLRDKLNKSIEQKILNVYEPVIYNVQGLSTLFDNMQVAFNELESERIDTPNSFVGDLILAIYEMGERDAKEI